MLSKVAKAEHTKRYVSISTSAVQCKIYPSERFLRFGLKIPLRMLTRRTEKRSLFGTTDKTTVATLPPDILIATEEVAIGEELGHREKAGFVLDLDGGDKTKDGGHLVEPLSLGCDSKGWVEGIPLLTLTLGCGKEIFVGGGDATSWVGGFNDGSLATLEELEEYLGVLLLL